MNRLTLTALSAITAVMGACVPLDGYIQSLPEGKDVEPDWKPSPEVLQGEGFTRQDVAFPCGDTTCAAWLYLPAEAEAPPPVVVMANGFCGTRNMIMPDYAERFARAGLAAFSFDYRHWGDSGGLPRNTAVAEKQVEDYLSALAWVRASELVDGTRTAVWGTSYSGAHVITVASRDPEVKALVSQVPGLAGGEGGHPPGLWKLVRLAFMDKSRAKKGEPRIYVTAYGAEGEVSWFPGALDDVRALVPADVPLNNQVTAGELLDMDEYHPLRYARDVQAPGLFVVAEHDELIGNHGAHKAAERMADGRVESVDSTHFGFYTGEPLERSAQLEIEFLQQHLAR